MDLVQAGSTGPSGTARERRARGLALPAAGTLSGLWVRRTPAGMFPTHPRPHGLMTSLPRAGHDAHEQSSQALPQAGGSVAGEAL